MTEANIIPIEECSKAKFLLNAAIGTICSDGKMRYKKVSDRTVEVTPVMRTKVIRIERSIYDDFQSQTRNLSGFLNDRREMTL